MMSKLEKNSRSICLLILLAGFFLKMLYGLMVPYNISSHDLWDVSDWNCVTLGHLGYIQFLYQFKELPYFFDGQFYHPPFFYILSAVIMAIVYGLTMNIDLAFEWIQQFNLIIAFGVSVYSYRLLKLYDIKGLRLIASTIFFAGLPLLYNMGGCINNDCLMSLLCVMTVFYVIKWEKTISWADMIKAALCMGFSMFTKTSAGLIAPGIALFFVYKLVVSAKDTKNLKKIVFNYFVFGIISIPIGMFWLIRQNIKCGMPFDYIMPLSKQAEAVAISSFPFWIRLGIPSVQQMTSPFPDYSDFKNSANIWGQSIQTTLFDEGIFNYSVPFFKLIADSLIWLFALLSVFLIIKVVSFSVNKTINIQTKLLLLGIFAVLAISYISFCFKYPYICTMNTRYIYCIFPIMIIAYGLSPRLKENSSLGELLEKAEFFAISLFGLLSVILYLVPII